jgi:hypothetical protein
LYGGRKKFVLSKWEFRRGQKWRRSFYLQLEGLLFDLSPKSWRRVGTFAYLLEERCSKDFEELPKRFEGPEFSRRRLS